MAELRQTADGMRHVVSPVGGSEHALCGIAFDAHELADGPQWAAVPLTGRTVTCGDCAAVVEVCRSVRLGKTRNTA